MACCLIRPRSISRCLYWHIIEGRPKKFMFIPMHRGRVLGSKVLVEEAFIRFRDSLYQSLGFDD